MTQRFIVAGPIDGLFHVLYKSPRANVCGPISHHGTGRAAIDEAEMLNAEQVIHESELAEKS